jgi:flagellar assembly protein FliH
MRRIPGARIRLIRVPTPQPVHEAPARAGEDSFSPFHEPASPAVPDCAPRVHEPESVEPLADAYTRGVEEGRQMAEAEFRATLAHLRDEEHQRLSALVASIADQMKALQRTIERDAYRFALAVAERIIRRDVTMTDDIVITQIKEAIQRIVGVESIKLRVHPSDEGVVRAHRSLFLSSLDNLRDVVIETDEGMERGGCIIESASGNVDARISTQLRQIEASLFGGLPAAAELVP